MKNKFTSNRINWIDCVKGIAILCIMWRHVQGPSDLRNWVCTFHVPIFLIISGYLYAYKGCSNFNILLRKNIPPYIIFSLLAIIVELFYNAFFNKAFSAANLLINIYKTICGFGISALWFIPSYLIANYVFFNIINVNKKVYTMSGLLIGAIISLSADNFVSFVYNHTSSIVYNITFYPIISLSRSFGCVLFIAIGYYLYRCCQKLKAIHTNLPLFIGIIFLLLSYPLSTKLDKGVNFSLLTFGSTPVLYYLSASFSSIGMISITYLLYKLFSLPLLEFYGRNSLILMATHMSLNLTSLSINLVNKIFLRPDTPGLIYYFHGFICLIVMLIIELPIISLLNGRLNFLINSNSCIWRKFFK